MNCEQVTTLLSEYIDGELAADQKNPVERHLADCASCRTELDSIRRTVALVESLPKAHAPANLANQVRAQLQQQVVLRRRALVLRWARIGGALAAAATLVVVIKLGGWESLERTAPRSPAPAAPGVKPDKGAVGTVPTAARKAGLLTPPGEKRDAMKDHQPARRTVAGETAGLLKEQGPPTTAPAPAAPPPREEEKPGPAGPEVPPVTTEMQPATSAGARVGQTKAAFAAAVGTAAERASTGREKLGPEKEAGESMKQEAPASDAVYSTSAPAAVRAVAPGAVTALPTFIYECKDKAAGLVLLKAVLAEILGSAPEEKELAPAKDEVTVTVPRDKLAEFISRLALSPPPSPKNATGKQEEVEPALEPALDAAEKPPAPDVTVKLLIRLKPEK